ncbi:hypothetical protein D1AOALGA4SA_1459 [Olavius algarvensis Delta 1 endosymbiont]|nr:hypothetical protein D1AOALGA4SA_1459 [Olavius algarvensis Delta 1 endosymbiont]
MLNRRKVFITKTSCLGGENLRSDESYETVKDSGVLPEADSGVRI